MKLRNKKTGVIIEPDRVAVIKNTKETDTASFNRIAANYYSLAKLNEEWEDYEPKEPLIKDEKVRKAVRAWAEANDFAQVFYAYDYSNDVAVFMVGETKMSIEADELLDDIASYTIAELCGEEEG